MSTPNYLGFLQTLPKESPLQSALQGGLQTYGEVQKLKQQRYITQAMPKEIQQEQTLKQEEIDTKQLLLNALPQEIKNKLTGEQLENAIKSQSVAANRMTLQQNQDVYFGSKIAMLRDMETRGMPADQVNDQYQKIRSQMQALGTNMQFVPKTYDDSVRGIGDSFLLNSPAALEKRKFDEEMQKQELINKGKLDEKQLGLMGDSAGMKEWYSSEAKEDSKYATTVTQEVGNAQAAVNGLQQLYALANQHPEYFGYIAGRATGKVSDVGNTALSGAYGVVLNEAESLKGQTSMFRTSTMQNILLQSKPDPKQPLGAFVNTISRHLVEQQSRIARAQFWNFAENNGVRNRVQLENSWNDFMRNSGVVDAKGNYHPEKVGGWAQYFSDNPDRLPAPLANAYAQRVQASAQQNNVISNGGLVTPYGGQQYSNTNQLLVGQ